MWYDIKALGKLATKALRDEKCGSNTIFYAKKGFELVQHSHISYYESKSNESSTILTNFALP